MILIYFQVGGQVKLYGLPGPPTMPVWVRLSRDAKKGDKSIYVDADVSRQWPVGGEIVITSSDYNRHQAEKFIITKGTNLDPFFFGFFL
jgi:hypothetical protein